MNKIIKKKLNRYKPGKLFCFKENKNLSFQLGFDRAQQTFRLPSAASVKWAGAYVSLHACRDVSLRVPVYVWSPDVTVFVWREATVRLRWRIARAARSSAVYSFSLCILRSLYLPPLFLSVSGSFFYSSSHLSCPPPRHVFRMIMQSEGAPGTWLGAKSSAGIWNVEFNRKSKVHCCCCCCSCCYADRLVAVYLVAFCQRTDFSINDFNLFLHLGITRTSKLFTERTKKGGKKAKWKDQCPSGLTCYKAVIRRF